MFTQRHYEFLAAWLREIYVAETNDDVARFWALSLADKLVADNPRFDRARFLRAVTGQ